MTVKMKEIEDSEINQAVLLDNLENGRRRTTKQWIWEYKGNYPELSVFVVIKDDDKVVGTQGIIPIYLNIRGERHLSGKSESSLLAPEYRGRGLFTRLKGLALSTSLAKGMCCVWGLGGVSTALRASSRLGFQIYRNVMCESVLILSPRRFVKSIIGSRRGLAGKIAKSSAAISMFVFSRFIVYVCSNDFFPHSHGFSVTRTPRSTNEIERLYSRLRDKYRSLIHLEQDEKYINWRVFRNPNVKYSTCFAYKDSSLGAYCYVALLNTGEACLSDFTFEDPDTGNFLLETILNSLKRRRVSAVSFVGNIRNKQIALTFDMLRRHGFMKMNFGPFTLRNLSYKDEKCLYDVSNWYINALWSEGFVL